MDDIRLTSFSPAGGCGAKMPAEYLDAVLRSLNRGKKRVSKDVETREDAAVYELGGMTLLHTVDFFTPIVDDPYTFGQIVATNALNDIYAMGGVPLHALNLVEFPIDGLNIDVLTRMLRGGQDKAAEAGVGINGGHTLRGSELKYGMTVLGRAKPGKVFRNSTAKPDDVLFLTKPLGVGVIVNAIKNGVCDKKTEKRVCKQMTTLSDRAAEVMRSVGVNACTDITGFGFIGHALEMAKGSRVCLRICANSVPRLEAADELLNSGMTTQSICANRNFFSRDVVLMGKHSNILLDLFYSAETAGGLLISVDADDADALSKSMKKNGVEAWRVGQVMARPKSKVLIG